MEEKRDSESRRHKKRKSSRERSSHHKRRHSPSEPAGDGEDCKEKHRHHGRPKSSHRHRKHDHDDEERKSHKHGHEKRSGHKHRHHRHRRHQDDDVKETGQAKEKSPESEKSSNQSSPTKTTGEPTPVLSTVSPPPVVVQVLHPEAAAPATAAPATAAPATAAPATAAPATAAPATAAPATAAPATAAPATAAPATAAPATAATPSVGISSFDDDSRPRTLIHYVHERERMLKEAFSVLNGSAVDRMLPRQLQGVPLAKIKELCQKQITQLSEEQLRGVIEEGRLFTEEELGFEPSRPTPVVQDAEVDSPMLADKAVAAEEPVAARRGNVRASPPPVASSLSSGSMADESECALVEVMVVDNLFDDDTPTQATAVPADSTSQVSAADRMSLTELQKRRRELEVELEAAREAPSASVPTAKKAKVVSSPPAKKSRVVSAPPAKKSRVVSVTLAKQSKPVSAPQVEKSKVVSAPPVEKSKPVSASPGEKSKVVSAPPVEKSKPVSASPVEKSKVVSALPVEKAKVVSAPAKDVLAKTKESNVVVILSSPDQSPVRINGSGSVPRAAVTTPAGSSVARREIELSEEAVMAKPSPTPPAVAAAEAGRKESVTSVGENGHRTSADSRADMEKEEQRLRLRALKSMNKHLLEQRGKALQ